MKRISLNSGALLELPDCWEDLTREQLLFTVEVLMRLFSGVISPDAARVEMLIHYSSYRPSRKTMEPDEREIIRFNLLKLSEELDFAFRVEDNLIQPRFRFFRNPLPELRVDGVDYPGKIFNVGLSVRTDITAREFIDAFNLVAGFREMEREDLKEECLNQLCAILYPVKKNHLENMVSTHAENIRKVDIREKTLVFFWFSGIIHFYTEHPVYQVLFAGKDKGDNNNRLHVGAVETALYLKKEGYGDPDTMNLNDYFDAQFKALKDSLSHALAEGVKIEKIQEKTGIPAGIIQRLT